MPPNDFPSASCLAASRLAPAQKIDATNGFAFESQRVIAVEMPVSFVYGDAPYAVMMASPGDAEDFAYGFSLTEGIVRSASEIRGLKVSAGDKGMTLDIELSPGLAIITA